MTRETQTVVKVLEDKTNKDLLDRVVEASMARRVMRKIRKTITTMRRLGLGEAIRIGAKGRKQAFRALHRSDGSVCAWGAAAIGIGMIPHYADPLFSFEPKHLPCPQGGCDSRYKHKDMLIHLNDGHRWSLEAIAGWVEQNLPEVKTLEQVTVTEEIEVEEEV